MKHCEPMLTVLATIVLGLATTATESRAQLTEDDRADLTEGEHTALIEASQNPVASLISLPFQNNFNFGAGEDDDLQYSTLVQPVVPMSLSENWNLINRGIIPIVSQPKMAPGGSRKSGLGDMQYQGYLSPAKPGKVIWGIGPVITVPSATKDILGSEKWSAGPGVVVLSMPGDWVIGTLVNNVWSFAGDGSRRNVNLMTWQYFINYNIPGGHGWYLSSSPTMTANWKGTSGNKWTVPVGGGAGRVFAIGKQHVNAKLQFFGFPEKPKGGPDWGMQFQFTFLFPKKG